MTLGFKQIPPLGNLEAYIKAVKQFPYLTPEEETHHLQNIQTSEDSKLLIIISHLRLVVALARPMKGYGVPMEELIQEGNLGLMKAADKFEPQFDNKFVSYATMWIKSSMNEHVLKFKDQIRLYTTKAQRKLFFNFSMINAETLTPKRAKLIATELNVPEKDVWDIAIRGEHGKFMTIDKHDDNEGWMEDHISRLPDNSMSPEAVLESARKEWMTSCGVDQALSTLDERSQSIIRLRYMNDEKINLTDCGIIFGVSAERIRQIEVKALQKLKAELNLIDRDLNTRIRLKQDIEVAA